MRLRAQLVEFQTEEKFIMITKDWEGCYHFYSALPIVLAMAKTSLADAHNYNLLTTKQ